MRRIFKYGFGVMAIVLTIVSCTPNSVDVYQGPDKVHFMTTQDQLIVGEDNPVIEIEVGTTVAHSKDRTYTISVIDEGTTAIEGVGFELVNETVTIPAGEVLGRFSLRGLFAGALVDGTHLNLTLTDPSHGEVASFDNVFSIDFYKFCDFDSDAFIGTYTLIEHSIAYGENEYEVTTTAAGLFSIYVDGLWAIEGSKVEVTFNRDSTNCYISDQPFFISTGSGNLISIKSYEDGVFNSCTGIIEGLACYVYSKEKDEYYDIVTFDLYKKEAIGVQSINDNRNERKFDSIKAIDIIK